MKLVKILIILGEDKIQVYFNPRAQFRTNGLSIPNISSRINGSVSSQQAKLAIPLDCGKPQTV